jgi:arabinan endo-1,5-alpha-L-arabinosidase
MKLLESGIILILAASLAASPAFAGPLEEGTKGPPPAGAPGKQARGRGLSWVHDPSTIVRCKDEYWLFSTGTGIFSRRSRDLVTWTAGPQVFSTMPKWLDETFPGHRGHFWAPDVIALKGRYLLYYSVSRWGKNTSAIALARSPTLDPADPAYLWKDEGIVIRSSEQDNFNAIDPSVAADRDGRLWLAFGSFWSGIKLVELDPATGLRKSPDSPIHALASAPEIEAPCLVAHGDYYHLFVNWGLCCRGVKSTYRILVGRSRQITGPYVDRDGRDLREGGGSPFLETEGRFIGPGHPAVIQEGEAAWLSYHFYDGERAGAATLAVRQLEWDSGGWPVAGSLLSPPEAAREAKPAPPAKPGPPSKPEQTSKP